MVGNALLRRVRSSSTRFSYLGASAAVAVASVLTSLLEVWLGPNVSLFFFPAILVSAIYGGYGPALFATVASTCSLAYFFIPPKHSFSIGLDDALRLAVFMATAVLTAWLSSSRRAAEARERQTLLDLAARDNELALREERMRVARDLHDGVLQGLTGIRLELQDIAETAFVGTAGHDRLLAIERALAIEQRELRRLVDDLKPAKHASPVEGTFVAALQARLDRLSAEWKTPIVLDVPSPSLRVPPPMQQAVLLMCHEAAINALKHAKPSRVNVSVHRSQKSVSIVVTDDGAGFNFEGRLDHDTLIRRDLGPASLRDRAAALRGRLIVESSSRGSRLDIEIPFQH